MHLKLSFRALATVLLIASAARAELPAAPAPLGKGKQSVTVELTVVEVNLTKMRAIGFDWEAVTKKPPASKRDAKELDPVQLFAHTGFLKALAQYDLATVMSQPCVMTLNGRPASVAIGDALKLDVVPIILGSGGIQVEHRLELAHSGLKFKSESTVEVESGQSIIARQSRRELKDDAGKVQEMATLVIVRATTDAPERRAAAAVSARPSTQITDREIKARPEAR